MANPLVPPLPLSLHELLSYFEIAHKECQFLQTMLHNGLEHLEARMKPSALVSVQFNRYEDYFVSYVGHLRLRLTDLFADSNYDFLTSKEAEAIRNLEYTHSGIAHPIDEREIRPMLDCLDVIDECLPGVIENIRANMLASIFVCHSSADKPFVRWLAEKLISKGASVWLDEAEIKVGDSIVEKLEQGISLSDYLGVVLSKKSIKSVWVKKEFQAALTEEIERGRVKVLPILLEDCKIPPFLADKRYADFRKKENHATALAQILDRLAV